MVAEMLQNSKFLCFVLLLHEILFLLYISYLCYMFIRYLLYIHMYISFLIVLYISIFTLFGFKFV